MCDGRLFHSSVTLQVAGHAAPSLEDRTHFVSEDALLFFGSPSFRRLGLSCCCCSVAGRGKRCAVERYGLKAV